MKYIKFSLIIFVVCASVSIGIYHLYAKGYQRFYSFENGRLSEMINGGVNHDILFLGSSRTFYHINPRVIDSITSLSSFNAGMDGSNVTESNLLLQSYLSTHKPPKAVVLDLARISLTVDKKPFWNPNLYYPFLDNPVVFDMLKPYKRVYMLKYLPFTQYFETDDMLRQNAVLGYFGKRSVDSNLTYKGHLNSGTDTLVLPYKRVYPMTNMEVDKSGVDILRKIVETCKQNNIQLVFTYAPVYKLMDEKNPEFYPTIEKIAFEYNVPFWNYRTVELGNNHKLFRDEHHLNNTGSDIYSAMVAEDLNKLLSATN